MISPLLLFSSLTAPIQVDYAIFLFDNGDKNMMASMLKYAEENDKSTLENLNFRIIFMGASVDAMAKEPFSHYPDKLLHYHQLGVTETIDHTWKRDRKLDSTNLSRLLNLEVQKKIWVGVSCSIFEQILDHYQRNSNVEIVAIRDNPNPDGDTDYFRVAEEVQNAAKKLAVPSKAVFKQLDSNQEVIIIGHAPIEECQAENKHLDKNQIIEKLGLHSQLPIVVYAGVYGEFYKKCFNLFLDIVPRKDIELLVIPHPRYKGIVEKEVCNDRQDDFLQLQIIGEFVEEPLKRIKTVEAISIADIIVTADATSTIVFQANALNKKVLYVNPSFSKTSDVMCNRKLIYRISSKEEFLKIIQNGMLRREDEAADTTQDIFKQLGIPKQSAKLLWNEFLN